METDSEPRQGGFQVLFKLVGRAVAQGRVAAVEVEVGVQVVRHFQAGFFEGGERRAGGQQLGFECTPTGFGLGVVIRSAGPAEAGHGPGLGDAGPASGAGVLAAAVGVDNQARSRLAQRQGLL